jgi:hypothetical protein
VPKSRQQRNGHQSALIEGGRRGRRPERGASKCGEGMGCFHLGGTGGHCVGVGRCCRGDLADEQGKPIRTEAI